MWGNVWGGEERRRERVRACLERNAKSSSVHTIIAELVVEATGWIYHTRQLEEARDRRDVGGEEGRFAGRARGNLHQNDIDGTWKLKVFFQFKFVLIE